MFKRDDDNPLDQILTEWKKKKSYKTDILIELSLIKIESHLKYSNTHTNNLT